MQSRMRHRQKEFIQRTSEREVQLSGDTIAARLEEVRVLLQLLFNFVNSSLKVY